MSWGVVHGKAVEGHLTDSKIPAGAVEGEPGGDAVPVAVLLLHAVLNRPAAVAVGNDADVLRYSHNNPPFASAGIGTLHLIHKIPVSYTHLRKVSYGK